MDIETKTKLRTGFTTGSCATASSKACVLSIINQKKIEQIDIILPKRSRLDIKINSCEFTKDSAKCSVIKDGGDDPEVLFHLKKIEKCLKNKKVISKK